VHIWFLSYILNHKIKENYCFYITILEGKRFIILTKIKYFFYSMFAKYYNTILSFEKNQRFLLYFGEIINESSKNTENALIEWFRKETTRFFMETKVYGVSLILSLVFKTGFRIFLAPLVCLKIRNVWKLPSPCS
jgi:hypothetical protein